MSSRHGKRSRSRSPPSRRRRSRSRERGRKEARVEVKREEGPREPGGGEKKLSLAEQKALLLQKKEALLRKKALSSLAAVKQEPEALLPSLKMSETGDGPIPLILDEQGRQVDLTGKVVSASASKAATNKSLLINKRVEREKVFGKAEADIKKDPAAKGMFDQRLGGSGPGRRERKGFRFIEPGTIVRKADRARAEQKLDSLNQQLAKTGEEMTPEIVAEMKQDVDAAFQRAVVEKVPAYEWWDLALVSEEDYGPASYDELEARALTEVNALLEHPKETGSSGRADQREAVVPLMLTEKERKRMRREQRVAKQEDTRAKITLGLIPPPPPKVKLSNMERVYGSKMVENPTAVEAEVRKAMQARLLKHLMDNEARKLTPTERREKKIASVISDRKEELRAAVFRIDDLSNSRHAWKVQMNAKQCHCTGVLVAYPSLNVLLIEGGNKAMKHMKKLMLRRIDWTEKNEDAENPEADDDNDDDDAALANNKCALVWEGVIPKPAFARFSMETIPDGDAAAARQIFEDARVPQYWDVARSSIIDDALVANQTRNL